MQKIAMAVLTMMLTSHAASAASIPAICEAAKQQAAGTLRQCLHGAEQKLVLSGDPVAYGTTVTKCTGKFAKKWQQAEDKAVDRNASCPSTGDASTVATSIAGEVACLTAALNGADSCLSCGDGAIDVAAGEDCDLGTLGGASCATATGDGLAFGTLRCAADCGFDTSGCKHCPGQMVGGHCWLLAAEGVSCDATCGGAGLGYAAATGYYAGGTGNTANCIAVLEALGPGNPAYSFSTSGPGGLGCFITNGILRQRDPSATTGGAAGYSNTRRACACE